jgi:hypothetical protein
MNNHITCSYCGSSLNKAPAFKEDKVYCEFCDMFVIPSQNGERIERFERFGFVPGYEQLKMKTPQLLELHTLDLLLLLQFCRDERRNYFSTMRIIKIAAADEADLKKQEEEAGEQYEIITRKCFVIENILRERIGYIPRKVTKEMLSGVLERSENERNQKAMKVKSS